MNLLLDTHTLLWFNESNVRISQQAKNLINDPANICFVSMVSFWEMSIKAGQNKLSIEGGFKRLYLNLFKYNFRILNIEFPHLLTLQTLSHHHGDPFDRLLIVQAISENLSIVSADKHFQAYPVSVSW